MILWIYNKLWLIAYPFIIFYIKKRARKNPDYLNNISERFEGSIEGALKNVIWIHAVSVGETKAAYPIVKLLLEKKLFNILITNTTPTGKKMCNKLMPNIQNRYLPYDNIKYVKKFLDEHNPVIVIFMETEVWPNYLIQCFKRNIPIYLANARISDSSYNYYARFANFFNKLFCKYKFIFSQSENDLIKFKNLGAKNIGVYGNTKYDVSIDESQYILSDKLRNRIGNRKCVVFGSTREYKGNNENIILIDEILKSKLDVLYIIVPRHPEYFEDTYNYANSLNIKIQKDSLGENIDPDTKILIGDTLGQMYSYYLISDIVFIGGSLVDSGCQNIIESLSCYKPTIFGYSTYNFEYVCKSAKDNGCAIQVFSVEDLFKQIKYLLSDKKIYRTMKDNINNYINSNQGSSNKIVDFIIKDSLINDV